MSRSRKRRKRRKQRTIRPLLILGALFAAGELYAHRTELGAVKVTLILIAAGLIVGGVIGHRHGRSRAVVVTKSPPRKAVPAKPAAQKPKRIVHRDVDPDALLAEMENWSDDCVDGQCGECSGYNPAGGTCTHCNHPGRRRGPGEDIDLDSDNEEIPY